MLQQQNSNQTQKTRVEKEEKKTIQTNLPRKSETGSVGLSSAT